MKTTLGLAYALLLAACTTRGGAPPRASATSPDERGFIRTCGSAVVGDPNWRNAITIGPLALVGIPQASHLPTRAFRPEDGRYGAIKVLAVVDGHENITLTVSVKDGDGLTLLYDSDARANKHGFLFSAGDPRVTFEACPGIRPQYNGGFIAKEPTCARLQVETESSVQSGSLAIGRGSCP